MKFNYSNPYAAVVAVALVCTSNSQAQTRTWDGGGANDNWDTVNNWDNNALPANTADVVFGTAFGSGNSIDLIANRIVNSLTIDTATAFTIIGGNNLTLTSGQLTRNDVIGTEGNHSITAAVVLGANGVFNINGSGVLTIDGAIGDGANTFSLTKSGNGVLVLSGAAETYNGNTIVSGGILRLGANNQIPDGTGDGNLIVNSGGTFDLEDFSDTINGLSGDGIVDKTAGAADQILTVGGNNANGDFSGVIQNTDASDLLGLTKTGAGIQILSGDNTYRGVTTVSNGALNIQHANALGTTAGSTTVATGAALQIQGDIITAAEALAIDGTGISADGALRNLSGTNTYSGAITINSTTRINSDSGLLTLDVASGNAITGTNDNLTFGGAGDVTVADAIATGAGTLTKDGNGKLILSAANSFTGLTTVSAGTLEYGITNALSSGAVTVSGGTLDLKTFNDTVGAVTLSSGSINGSTGVLTGTSYALTNTGSVGAILAGAVNLTKTGAGTATLSGENTYTGVTAINQGVLSVATIGDGGVTSSNLGSATSAAANLVLGGGTLQYTGSTTSTNRNFTLTTGTSSTIEVVNAGTDLTLGGASANTTGGLAKTGAGKLILTGANLYTGLTTVSAGTLEYGVTNALSSGAVTVSGGTLDIKTFNDTVGAVTLSSGSINGTTGVLTGTSYAMQSGSVSAILGGGGAMVKSTAGIVTLSGNNTFSGGLDLTAGTLVLGHNSAAGTGTLDLGGGTIEGSGGARTITNNLAITGNNTFGGTEDLEFTDSFDQVAARNYTVNNTTTFSGNITGGDNLTKSGTGTLVLSGTNTIDTVAVNTGGALRVSSDGALGSTAFDTNVNSGGALELIGGRTIGAEAMSLNGSGVSNGGALRNISGNNSWAGTITLADVTAVHRINSDSELLTIGAGGITETGTSNNKDLTFGGAGNIAVTGNITASNGDMRVFKDGPGTLTLSGVNAYDGTTNITGGTLLANNTTGSATGTGAVSVGASGRLGGTGTITPTGANGFNVTGVLAPGGSLSPGNLTFNLGSTTGTVVMNSAADFEFDLGLAGVDINNVGTSDLITLAGAAASDFAFNGNTIDFLGSGAIGFYKLFDTSSNNALTWTGISFDGTGLITGLTATNLAGGFSGNLIMGGNSLGGTSGDIYLQVVPEPSSVLLGGIGAMFLLRRRRTA